MWAKTKWNSFDHVHASDSTNELKQDYGLFFISW